MKGETESTAVVPYEPIDLQKLAEEQNRRDHEKRCACVMPLLEREIVSMAAAGIGGAVGQSLYDALTASGWVRSGWYALRMGVAGIVQSGVTNLVKAGHLLIRGVKVNWQNFFWRFAKESCINTTWWGMTDGTDHLFDFPAELLNGKRSGANITAIVINKAVWEGTYYLISKKFCQGIKSENNSWKEAAKEFAKELGGDIGFWLDGPLPFPSPPGSRDALGGCFFTMGGYFVVMFVIKAGENDFTCICAARKPANEEQQNNKEKDLTASLLLSDKNPPLCPEARLPVNAR